MDFSCRRLAGTALSLSSPAAWLSPTALPLTLSRFSLHPFSSPAVLLVIQLCLCSPWMSESPCTAGTEPVKDLGCRSHHCRQTDTELPLHGSGGLLPSFLLSPLSPGLLFFPCPLLSAPLLPVSPPRGNLDPHQQLRAGQRGFGQTAPAW